MAQNPTFRWGKQSARPTLSVGTFRDPDPVFGQKPIPTFNMKKGTCLLKNSKDIRVTIRLTPEQYESIKSRADTAHLSLSFYIRAAAMRHKVTVVDGLPEMTRELKGLGRNLNQLTVLAHQGHITSPDLSRTASVLERCYTELHRLTEQERR